MQDRQAQIEQIVVTAEQMRAIEEQVFNAGMPVAALMEKVAGLIARQIQMLYPPFGENIKPVEPEISRLQISKFPTFSPSQFRPSAPLRVGVLVGPGHNGGDALVVARELHFRGYKVAIYCPFTKLKELTGYHAQYAASLGIPCYEEISPLFECDLLIDGLFGFGLERPIKEPIASAIDQLNQWSKPVLSIDIPSGLHTDTGEVLGTAVRATHTFCLGLWKLGLLQDQALEYIGTAELIDFDLQLEEIWRGLGNPPAIRRITTKSAVRHLPLPRPPAAHKYQLGHLLLICGSRKYTGAAILAGLGARASGVGMLSIAVPESLKPTLSAQLPEALIIGCPETYNGAINKLPVEIDLNAYSAIACGPGLTLGAAPLVERTLETDRPLVLDADGLNVLAHLGTIPILSERRSPTIVTPHPGEFKRLFPDIAGDLLEGGIARRWDDSSSCTATLRPAMSNTGNLSPNQLLSEDGIPQAPAEPLSDRATPFAHLPLEGGIAHRLGASLANPLTLPNRIIAAQAAAKQSGVVVLLKGARVVIGYPNGSVWINPDSTPALARGGSGDVLTGLMGGLIAQATASEASWQSIVPTAVWWHAQAGKLAAQERTELGVDAFTLTNYLMPVLVLHRNLL